MSWEQMWSYGLYSAGHGGVTLVGVFKKSGRIGAGGLGGRLWRDKWSKLEQSKQDGEEGVH